MPEDTGDDDKKTGVDSEAAPAREDQSASQVGLVRIAAGLALCSLVTSAYLGMQVGYLKDQVEGLKQRAQRSDVSVLRSPDELNEAHKKDGAGSNAASAKKKTDQLEAGRAEFRMKVKKLYAQNEEHTKNVLSLLSSEQDARNQLRTSLLAGKVTREQARDKRHELSKKTMEGFKQFSTPEQIEKLQALREEWAKLTASKN